MNSNRGFYLIGAVLIIAVLLLGRTSPTFTPQEQAASKVIVSGILKLNGHEPSTLRFVPNGCLKKVLINGIPQESQGQACDPWGAVSVDVRGGSNANTFSLEAVFSEAPRWDWPFFITIPSLELLSSGIGIVICLCAGYLLYGISRRCELGQTVTVLLLAGYALRVLYWSYTDFNTRTLDVLEGSGHFDYIIYILDNWSLPNPSSGWEYHQPFLYYVLMAVLNVVLLAEGSLYQMFLFQGASLVFSIAFIVFGALIVKHCVTLPALRSLSSALLILWPVGIMHSVRVGNDSLIHCFYAAGLFFLIRWYQKSASRDLVIASCAAALAMLTKPNGAILAILICCVFCCKTFSHALSDRGLLRRVGLISLVVGILFLGAAGSKGWLIYQYYQGTSPDWLVGQVNSNPALLVPNDLWRYFYFDYQTFLERPFTDSWNDENGRLYFWNYLIKSSLFSEFSFHNSWQPATAVLLSLLGLAVWLFGLGGPLFFDKKRLQEALPLILNALLLVLGLVFYRYRLPNASNTDFRYVFSMVLSLAVLPGNLIEQLLSQNRLGWAVLASLLVGLFTLASFCFYLLPFFSA